jgi:hypothetical protein
LHDQSLGENCVQLAIFLVKEIKMRRSFSRSATVSLICLALFSPVVRAQNCPARRLPNGQWASPNWCKQQRKPQILPTPNANPNLVQVPVPGGGTVSVPVSSACYTSYQPLMGCYLNQWAPIGSACYCVDPNSGNAYNGQIN